MGTSVLHYIDMYKPFVLSWCPLAPFMYTSFMSESNLNIPKFKQL